MKVSKRQTALKKRVLKRYPTKKELACKIGIHPAYFSRFLNDKLDLSNEVLDRIEKRIL